MSKLPLDHLENGPCQSIRHEKEDRMKREFVQPTLQIVMRKPMQYVKISWSTKVVPLAHWVTTELTTLVVPTASKSFFEYPDIKLKK